MPTSIRSSAAANILCSLYSLQHTDRESKKDLITAAISKRGQSREGEGSKTLFELPPFCTFFEKTPKNEDVVFVDVDIASNSVVDHRQHYPTASIESMATATRNVNAVDIENPDDLDKFVQDLMSSMVRHFFYLDYCVSCCPSNIDASSNSDITLIIPPLYLYPLLPTVANSIQPLERYYS